MKKDKFRLTHADRGKKIWQAVSRIERGRSHTKAGELTVASAAREASVSAALIHNHHPDVAEYIREKAGRSSRAQRDAKHAELMAEREKVRALTKELEEARGKIAKLVSINESLSLEAHMSRATTPIGVVKRAY